MLRLEDVSLRFPHDGSIPLSSINLELAPGKITGITGPSGGGKTLLGLVAAGIIPDIISAEIIGSIQRSYSDQSGRTQASIVFQDPAFQLFSRTVYDEMIFTPNKLGWPEEKIKDSLGDIVEGLKLEHLLSRPPLELSMGEIQRVAVGVSLIQYPRILVLDEPTQYMDMVNVGKTLEFVAQWAQRYDIAVMLIEHHVNFLQRFSEHMYYLDNGKLYDFDSKLPNFTPINAPVPKDSPPHVELERVHYCYHRGKPVLKDINLSVSKKEIVAVLGPNGSGKSTLAKIICGLYKPSSGAITHHHRRIKRAVSWYRDAGYIMQNPDQQIFAPNVMEECSFGPKNFGFSRSEYEPGILEYLKKFQLKGYENRDPFSLSYGEKRRVNIIGVLSYDPHIVIFDEPTCALDHHNQRILLKQIQRINDEGKSIIVITHDLEFAHAACNRAIFLRNGSIIRDAPMQEIEEEDVISLYTAG